MEPRRPRNDEPSCVVPGARGTPHILVIPDEQPPWWSFRTCAARSGIGFGRPVLGSEPLDGWPTADRFRVPPRWSRDGPGMTSHLASFPVRVAPLTSLSFRTSSPLGGHSGRAQRDPASVSDVLYLAANRLTGGRQQTDSGFRRDGAATAPESRAIVRHSRRARDASPLGHSGRAAPLVVIP